jgi:hypothetical protein
MNELMIKFEPIKEHVMANPAIYGVVAALILIIVYFTRPYSTSIIFYTTEICIYLFSMHTVMHVIVYLTAGFSNQTTMRNVFDGEARDVATWRTPWINFWDRDIYDPQWIMWFEIVLVIIIIGLVRYFRPMKVQTKVKSSTKAEPVKPKSKKKGKGNDDDDDDWGVPTTRRFTLPDDFVQPPSQKK